MFVFDKNRISKVKEKKTIIESVYKHVEILRNMQKYSSVTLKLVLAAKENRSVTAAAVHYTHSVLIASCGSVLTSKKNRFGKQKYGSCH